MTYPAYMYNALVDEYNSLTDGEKMNHVSKDVLEIEYDQLEACVEALYEKENAKAKKNMQDYEDQKKNMNNNKQNKLKMKHLNLMTIQMVLVLMILH